MVPKSHLRILGKVRVSSLGKASEEYTSFFELLVRDPLLILQFLIFCGPRERGEDTLASDTRYRYR